MSRTRFSWWVAGAVMMALTGAGAAGQIPRPRTVAIVGQELVQVGASTVTILNRPSVGSRGGIYFSGQYQASGNLFNAVLYAPRRIGDALIIRRQGAEVPELGPSVVWGSTFGLVTAHGGDVVFTGNYGGGGILGTGLWESAGPTLVLTATAQMGVPAPGTIVEFGAFHAVAIASPGLFRSLAVRASVNGPSTANSGVWVGPITSAGLALFALEGDQVPDAPAGVVYDDVATLPVYDPVTCTIGASAFLAPVRGTGVTAANNRAIIVGTPSAPRMVARTGDPAPGMPAGCVYAAFDRPYMNGQDVVFTGRVTGGGVTGNDDEGLWILRWTSDTPELIVREGIIAPIVGGTIILKERTSGLASFRHTIINAAGTIFFVSGLQGVGINNDNDGVVYRMMRETGGGWSFTLVAREGQDAPGLTMGVDRYGPFGQLFANATGDLAMLSQIQGSSAWAVYVGRPGAMKVAVAAGRQLDIGTPGSPLLRTVRSTFSQFTPITASASGGGSGDGLATCLSDYGTLVYRAEFLDGPPGIFELAIRTADITGEGQFTPEDIFQFLDRWFAFSPSSDFNGSGDVTVQDIYDFLESFFLAQ